MENGQKNFLGIDYGESKVGLALGENTTKIAFAYKTLDNNKELLKKLAEIIEKENVKTVIIGIPSRINRKRVEYAGEILGKKIKEMTPFLEVSYQDEMFTTKMAETNLIEKGIKGVKRYDDQEAARIILQSWLDKNFN